MSAATTPTFHDEPLADIAGALAERLGATGRAVIYVLDPDLGQGLFAGELFEHGGVRYRHRPLQSWLELAERLGCHLHTPRPQGAPQKQLVELTFSGLEDSSWHGEKDGGRERYGLGSAFGRVQKLEEPAFWLDYQEALQRVRLGPQSRVLSLGVGRGDELLPFGTLFPEFSLSFTGVDHSESALAEARRRFPGKPHRFIAGDLNELGGLGLGRFDLALSIATFQSPGVRGHELIREVVQNHLTERGSLILALPNCRYRDGELHFGAKLKNFARPDLSLVVKDLAFYRKYLQQHHFQVFLTGKYYLFVTAVQRR